MSEISEIVSQETTVFQHFNIQLSSLPPLQSSQSIFWNNSKFSDIIVTTSDGTQFWAHKVILAAHSKYFETLFNFNDTKVTTIPLDTKYYTILSKYMYGITSDDLIDNYSGLAIAADYLDMKFPTDVATIISLSPGYDYDALIKLSDSEHVLKKILYTVLEYIKANELNSTYSWYNGATYICHTFTRLTYYWMCRRILHATIKNIDTTPISMLVILVDSLFQNSIPGDVWDILVKRDDIIPRILCRNSTYHRALLSLDELSNVINNVIFTRGVAYFAMNATPPESIPWIMEINASASQRL